MRKKKKERDFSFFLRKKKREKKLNNFINKKGLKKILNFFLSTLGNPNSHTFLFFFFLAAALCSLSVAATETPSTSSHRRCSSIRHPPSCAATPSVSITHCTAPSSQHCCWHHISLQPSASLLHAVTALLLYRAPPPGVAISPDTTIRAVLLHRVLGRANQPAAAAPSSATTQCRFRLDHHEPTLSSTCSRRCCCVEHLFADSACSKNRSSRVE